jgi:hypothetical protein
MSDNKVLQFPIRYPELFAPIINQRELQDSQVTGVLYAAIRALPHVNDPLCREELKRALCELLLDHDGAA